MQHDELNDDGDSEAIAELERLGVDLTQSQSIEFHIAAPDATTAERIQTELRLRAFTATTYHDEGEPDQDGVIDPNDKTSDHHGL